MFKIIKNMTAKEAIKETEKVWISQVPEQYEVIMEQIKEEIKLGKTSCIIKGLLNPYLLAKLKQERYWCSVTSNGQDTDIDWEKNSLISLVMLEWV